METDTSSFLRLLRKYSGSKNLLWSWVRDITMEEINGNLMQQMMQQMMDFFQQQQTTQQRNNLEECIRKARQGMIEKLGRFDGRDISEFCQTYEEAMEDNEVVDLDANGQFHLIATLEL